MARSAKPGGKFRGWSKASLIQPTTACRLVGETKPVILSGNTKRSKPRGVQARASAHLNYYFTGRCVITSAKNGPFLTHAMPQLLESQQLRVCAGPADGWRK